MAHFKRTRLLVDARVQGSLIRRVVFYWLACVITVEFLNLSWQIATGPEQPTFLGYLLQYDLAAAAVRLLFSAILLVPITLDMLRLSNRFAGPIFRMQHVLRAISAGGAPHPVSLRKDDYWHEFADDLNAALSRLAPDSQLLEPERVKSMAERLSETS